MKAMILAAGFGTRLWPLTEDRTKPAIPFLNRPLIAYSVEYLASFGIRDIIINLHHQPESIREALGDGRELGVRIRYSLEEEILGTSGALDRVRDEFLDDDFIVINGKIVTDIDLSSAVRDHKEREAIASLVLRENTAREHFSIVEVDGRGCISSFAGFPDLAVTEAVATDAVSAGPGARKAANAPLMFTGIQVLSPRIFDYIPRGVFSHSTIHVYPRAIEAGELVLGHVAEGEWLEMSTIRRYLEASLLLMRKKGLARIEGTGCSIAEDAVIEDSILWDGVTVERGAHLKKAVLGDGVRIPSETVIEQAVVVRREIVTEMERGSVVGENVVVPM